MLYSLETFPTVMFTFPSKSSGTIIVNVVFSAVVTFVAVTTGFKSIGFTVNVV